MLLELAELLVHPCDSPHMFVGNLRIDPAVLHLRKSRHVDRMLLFGQPEVLLRLARVEEV